MRMIAVLTALALVCAGCATRAQPLTVQGPLTATPRVGLMTPSTPPSASPVGAICSNGEWKLGSGGTVDGEPSAVTAAWLPGMNARVCRAVVTTGTAVQARRLANDIRHLPGFPSGPTSCPSADETSVQLVFAYSASRYEQVVLELTGCAGIAGAGMMTTALATDLLPLAPPAWRPYVARHLPS